MKIDWIRKLTSRKLWMAVAGLVSGIIIAVSDNAEAAETISGIILSTGSVVAYILGEGFADAAAVPQKGAEDGEENQGH